MQQTVKEQGMILRVVHDGDAMTKEWDFDRVTVVIGKDDVIEVADIQ